MALPPLPDIPRVDARDKVMGAALFGTDHYADGLTHGAFAVATAPRGRITAIDTAAAEALPGVLLVVTHETLGPIRTAGFVMAGGHGFQSVQPLLSDEIHYRGQPIALVVADSLETAIEAAALVEASYEAAPFAATIDSELADAVPQAEAATGWPIADIAIGDADAAFAAAAVTVDHTYSTPRQHQNPMELIGTVARWEGDRLIIHEGTQTAGAIKYGVAAQLGIAPEQVDVISPHTGGGFGLKGALQSQTVLAAWAAREIGRPVKVVIPRRQMFHDATFRPATLQRVRLGADATGRITAALYEVDAQTSMHDFFQSEHADHVARSYGIGNFRSFARLVRTATPTPGYMRAPFEHASGFAIESAVDELAYELGLDPVAIRLANDTTTDAVSGLPLSSRHAAACLQRGAKRFGWGGRDPQPGSMRAANGDLVGMGVALGNFGSSRVPAVARLRASRDGSVELGVTGHDMGQGLRTALANALAGRLRLRPEDITVLIGDTRAAPQHVTAGSWGSASAVPTALTAADRLLAELAALGAPADAGATLAELLAAAGREELAVEVKTLAAGHPPEAIEVLDAGLAWPAGPVYPDFVTCSYIAHFVEVWVEPNTRRVRVPRVVSVADCGRVLSPRTARSQVIGGVVWGIGGALREAGEVDPRYGGVLNADIAEYLIPVNADVGTIEVDFIDEPDPLVEAGIKGLGEVVLVGVAAALANAIFHATGKRVRELPIRIEHLL